MVPVLHAGPPHRVSLRGFERSHPQLECASSSERWVARPHTVKVQYPDRGLSRRGAPAPVPSVRPVRPYPRYAGTFGKTNQLYPR